MSDYKDDNQEALKNLISGDDKQQSDFRPSPALIEKFVIRLPKGLRKKIKHLSEQNRRSMNSEIIMVLEQHIQQHLMDHTNLAETSAASGGGDNAGREAQGLEKPTQNELAKRLENLPEEKKQALLELLG
jgi:hypothetical protein